MASGCLLPVPLAGDDALELCNTYAGWGESTGREYLVSYEHLAVWARERGLLDADTGSELTTLAERSPGQARTILRRAHALRSAFYSVVTGDSDDTARATVAQEVERAARAARLQWASDGARFVLPTGIELPVLAIAQRIGAFITSPRPVGRCPGRGCGWLFTGGHGRRRWCSMAVCGNRAKVRRHAERQRQINDHRVLRGGTR